MCARKAWIAGVCLLAASAAGCDGFGRAVVDSMPSSQAGGSSECETPPRCQDARSVPAGSGISPIPIMPVALVTCGALVSARCGGDALGNAGAADAGVAADDCGTSLQLNAGDAQRAAGVLECAALRLGVDESRDVPSRVRITGARWAHSNVAITSTQAITLELETATLEDVWLELEGPVVLRVTQQSRMHDVRVRARATREGVPSIELVDAHAELLAIEGGDGALDARLALVRAHLSRTHVRAREVALESVAAGDLTLEAVDLNIADGAIDGATFAFEHAVIAAAQIRNLQIPQCGSLTIANGTFEHALLQACTDGPLRAYGVAINDSTVDGDVDADHALFDHVLFGAHDDAAITGWDSTFRAVNFCRHTRVARFGNLPSVQCSACEDRAREVDLHACDAPGTMIDLRKNFCTQLQQDPPLCPVPEPLRERPH